MEDLYSVDNLYASCTLYPHVLYASYLVHFMLAQVMSVGNLTAIAELLVADGVPFGVYR